MQLEKIIFINRAPFEHLELDFQSEGIHVLSAINGKGKTTILTHIVDAFHEMAKIAFSQTYEGKRDKYYRISSPIYDMPGAQYSLFYARFRHQDKHVDYFDCRGEMSEEEYNAKVTLEDKVPYLNIATPLRHTSNVKGGSLASPDMALEMFKTNVLTYFPSYRHEQPWYLNRPYKVDFHFNTEVDLSGFLPNPIEVISGLPQIGNWIMDIVLDWQVNKQVQPIWPEPFINQDITPESQLFEHLNQILSATLSSKIDEKRVRYGISRRGMSSQRISIIDIKDNSLITPNIFCLSSGEASLICLFSEILRQGDRLINNIHPSNISGIVLVDEIDKHLHIKLQKEVLPGLLRLFPKMQFIVSSHSPFLSMGLAGELKERSKIIDLEHGGISVSPYRHPLYTEVYEMMLHENMRFADEYRKLKAILREAGKALVITEGKTDIKHILHAKKKLRITDLDFDTLSPDEQPQGEQNLDKLLMALAKEKRVHAVIGIFDHDTDMAREIEKDGRLYKPYGNNVFAFCLQAPQARKEKNQPDISIEHLYSDEEITTFLNNNCRLFLRNEFDKNGRHKTHPHMFLSRYSGDEGYQIVSRNKKVAVTQETDGPNLLATKEDFANAVVSGEIAVSDSRWQNFLPIFNTIRLIINENTSEPHLSENMPDHSTESSNA